MKDLISKRLNLFTAESMGYKPTTSKPVPDRFQNCFFGLLIS